MRRLPNGARWREVPHGADRALWVRAGGLQDLVVGCVLAVSDFVWGVETLRPVQAVLVDVGDLRDLEQDPEGVIYHALAEALFLADARGLLVADALMKDLTEGHLRMQLQCDVLDPARHRRHRVVKAPTFHGMRLRRDRFGVAVRLILDV